LNSARADIPKTTFWAYDIFGYLLPGVVLLLAVTVANEPVRLFVVANLVEPSATDLLILFIGTYIVGHFIAAISSRLLEAFLLRHAWGYPTAVMFPVQNHDANLTKWRRFGRWLLRATAAILQPGYRRAYSSDFQSWFTRLFRETFQTGTGAIDQHDRFWMCWEHIALFHPAAYRRATHFLELYGFSRNVSAAFLLASVLPAFEGWSEPLGFSWLEWALVNIAIGAVFFANYLKLIRRMNDEVYRGFVVAARFKTPSEMPVGGQ
jgi:hypothetical protein